MAPSLPMRARGQRPLPGTEAPSGGSQLPEQGLAGLLKGLVSRNVRHLPRFILKNGLWIAALSALWVLLHSYPTHRLPGIGSLLVFITAAYNNFVAKALYIGVVNTAVLPAIKKVREDGAKELAERYSRTARATLRAFALLGPLGAVRTLLLYGGIGLVLSNALTRNNATDKYLICILTAYWLFDAMSQGMGNMVIRVFRAGYRDLFRQGATLETVYAALASTSVGLLLGFVPGNIGSRSYWDYKGYLIGALCIAASLAIGLAGGKDAGWRARS